MLEVILKADERSPIYNPALYIENWGDSKLLLKVNGEDMLGKGKSRIGYVNRLGRTDLIIWLEMTENVPVLISIVPKK